MNFKFDRTVDASVEDWAAIKERVVTKKNDRKIERRLTHKERERESFWIKTNRRTFGIAISKSYLTQFFNFASQSFKFFRASKLLSFGRSSLRIFNHSSDFQTLNFEFPNSRIFKLSNLNLKSHRVCDLSFRRRTLIVDFHRFCCQPLSRTKETSFTRTTVGCYSLGETPSRRSRSRTVRPRGWHNRFTACGKAAVCVKGKGATKQRELVVAFRLLGA